MVDAAIRRGTSAPRATMAKADPATMQAMHDEYRTFTQSIIQSGHFKGGDALERTATGILEISAWNQANALRQVTVARGLDVRDFTLTTFGGYLRVDPSSGLGPYYALEGAIDDLRISKIARPAFPYGVEP